MTSDGIQYHSGGGTIKLFAMQANVTRPPRISPCLTADRRPIQAATKPPTKLPNDQPHSTTRNALSGAFAKIARTTSRSVTPSACFASSGWKNFPVNRLDHHDHDGGSDEARDSGENASCHLSHLHPLLALAAGEYCVAGLAGFLRGAKRRLGRLPLREAVEEVGDLVHERVLVADLRAE